ncbi:PfkB domain protein [Parvibaculum lavamentivorans DS-1]|uniref:PfkB domain protein n=1 Tax=Parvibaculum lavamentivorans (strain DS-1 / DSM 13023 / NCIMB 13966) TaxID=402881 RepID=A7HSG5_PARL1|nr:adenosine kinase [Parvibaculum lavamentivorans]ABS62848.1 PfkB domain protein [Parvibaculum lavamentivorans DS-1]
MTIFQGVMLPINNRVGIGNALVDVIANADDKFLIANGIEKGGMTLIDAARADELYARMASSIEMSGGSCANTIAGLASLGGKGAFFGKVKNDQLGEVFVHDIKSLGVVFPASQATSGVPTGRCLIIVTPDAQRSMSTFLGAAQKLQPDDIDADTIRAAAVTYMEGYLWDEPGAKDAFLKAAKIAHDAGRLVSLTLSDSFCVGRYRDEFRRLAKDEVDILFANEAEILSLYETDVFDEALQKVRADCKFAALTRSEAGAVIVADGEVHVVDAEKVSKVVDTTGAGDLFAAGFLYGLTRGKSPVECGRLGAMAAAEIISHYGPRPQVSLAKLAKEKGLA